MSSTWGDILADSLREIGVYNPLDTLRPEDEAQQVRRLNRLIDSWAAQRVFAYASVFQLYTLTANYTPNLGPALNAPDFATPNAAPRPTEILSASLVFNTSTPSSEQPMEIRDSAWWAANRVKAITSDVPTDLYYQPLWPNGVLNFWPVAATNYQVRLEMALLLSAIPLTGAGLPNIAQTFSAPQGYERALVLTLAEESCDPYGKPMPASLPERARKARYAVGLNNSASPEIASVDWGTRGTTGNRRADFNWESGLPL